MRVLVTGGTGVVGKSAVDHLLARGHAVRLFSRHADRDVKQWREGVEPYRGSITDASRVCGAADGCEAVLHVTGIVAEAPPEVTFEKINVEGTRLVAEEAVRARVRRFVYVSSFGAEAGASRYHQSKRRAEEIVREVCRDVPFLVARVGNVFGCGDQVLSLLLRLVRALPVIPVVGNGDQPFQPIWADDLGEALARTVDVEGQDGQVLDLLGPERTTVNEVLDTFAEITGHRPVRVPVPEFLAKIGTEIADRVGLGLPIHADEVTMLLEGNYLPDGACNATTDVLGVETTPLRRALENLASALPEQLPAEGVGSLQMQRYVGTVVGASTSPEALLGILRERFAAITGEGAMSTEQDQAPELGSTLTMHLPVRGQVQVRVEELTPRSMTLVTIAGHPLAGAIRFLFGQDGDKLVVEVRSYARAATVVDLVGMRSVGKVAQRMTWRTVIEKLTEHSGGKLEGQVSAESDALDNEEADAIEGWLEDMIQTRKREEAA